MTSVDDGKLAAGPELALATGAELQTSKNYPKIKRNDRWWAKPCEFQLRIAELRAPPVGPF